jgi:polyisoprenoid-binding protein YceI
VSLQPGVYRLGPDDGTLALRTGRTGVAAKAGHDLLIQVTKWDATIQVDANGLDVSIELNVDSGSLVVKEGTGGIQTLGDDDKANIKKTIDDEILKRQPITFRSTQVLLAANGKGLNVRGDLTLLATTRQIAFDLPLGDDGALGTGVTVKQTDWGIKPYSTLFGTLKVADEVEVRIDVRLPAV